MDDLLPWGRSLCCPCALAWPVLSQAERSWGLQLASPFPRSEPRTDSSWDMSCLHPLWSCSSAAKSWLHGWANTGNIKEKRHCLPSTHRGPFLGFAIMKKGSHGLLVSWARQPCRKRKRREKGSRVHRDSGPGRPASLSSPFPSSCSCHPFASCSPAVTQLTMKQSGCLPPCVALAPPGQQDPSLLSW